MGPPEDFKERLLNAADGPSRHAAYQQEVQTMLSDLEKQVQSERRMVIAQWLFLVLLTTAFNVIGGYKHETMTGMWFSLQGIFWFLFGTVFLLGYRFSQLKLDVLKEIKRVELSVSELREAMTKEQ